MNTIELTTTEFRQNQKKFLDMASKGMSILIYRGKDMFILNHVPTEQRLDDETIQQIERARQQFKQGKTKSVTNRDELNKLLESL